MVLVTLSAITENKVQLPFKKQHKLYVSTVPYQIALSGGESLVTDHHRTLSDFERVQQALPQLDTMRTAKVRFTHGTEYTRPRNTVLVMISVVGYRGAGATVARLLSKSSSLAVFITGTAMFASVTLVSLPMAVLAITLVLSAGVFGRAIAGWMVRMVAVKEPMIHVIVTKEEEANHAIARILKVELGDDDAHVQVEINGHIFVNGWRVSKRPRWHLALFGVMSRPYDLRSLPSEFSSAASSLLPDAHHQ